MERAANDKLGQKLWWNHQPSASLVFISQETPNTWRKRNIFILMLFRWPCGGPGTPGYTRGEKGGRSTQGRVSFIIITQEKLENIQILLTIVWTCFQFFFLFRAGSCQGLCWLLLCILECSSQWLLFPANHSLQYFSAWPGWSNLWLVQWFKLKYHLAAI